MRSKIILAATGIGAGAALLLAPMAIATPSTMKVTGGGKIIASGTQGAGDTIAFTAQTDGTTTSGQLQYVPHTTSTPASHGVVDCVQTTQASNGNPATASLGGHWTSGAYAGKTFQVYAEDGGQGSKATQADMVTINPNSDNSNCASKPNQQTELGRGNVTVHKS